MSKNGYSQSAAMFVLTIVKINILNKIIRNVSVSIATTVQSSSDRDAYSIQVADKF